VIRRPDLHWLVILVFTLPGVGGAIGLGLRLAEVTWIPFPLSRILDVAFIASWVSLPFTAFAWLLAVAWVARLPFGLRTTPLRVLAVCVACPLATVGSWFALAFWGIQLVP
jgi:hypothetical protein